MDLKVCARGSTGIGLRLVIVLIVASGYHDSKRTFTDE